MLASVYKIELEAGGIAAKNAKICGTRDCPLSHVFPLPMPKCPTCKRPGI